MFKSLRKVRIWLTLTVYVFMSVISVPFIGTNQAVYAASSEPSYLTSLISNSSFETDVDSNSIPDGWTFTVVSGNPAGVWDSSESADGSHSAEVICNTTSSQGEWTSGAIKVLPNEQYNTSVLLKTDSVTDKPYIKLIFKSGSTVVEQVENENLVQGTQDWTQLYLNAVCPATADTLYVAVGLRGTGTAYFDFLDVGSDNFYNRIPDGSAEKNDGTGNPKYWWISGETKTPVTVTNPGFESSPASSGWTYAQRTGTSTVVFGAQTCHSGSNSAKISSTDIYNKADIFEPAASYCNVTAGDTYRITYWINTQSMGSDYNGNDSTAYLYMAFYDSSNLNPIGVEGEYVTGDTDGWKKMRFDCTVPAGRSKLRLDFYLIGTGTVYFDDITVEKVVLARDSSFANKDEGKAVVSWDSLDKYDYSKSLKAEITDDNYTAGWTSAYFPAQQPEAMTVSTMIKTVNAVYGAYVQIEYRDADDNLIQRQNSPVTSGSTGGYTEVVFDTYVPLNAAKARLNLILSESGTAYFDYIRVYKPSYNQVVNPDFEFKNESTGTAEGYTGAVWVSPGSFLWDNTASHTGSYSLKAAGTASTSKAGWIGSFVSVKGGKTYKFSTWVKTDEVADKAQLHVVFYNSSGTTISETDVATLNGTHNWTYISGDCTMPSNAVKARVDVRIQGIGTAWFDNLECTGPIQAHPSLLYGSSDISGLRSKASTPGDAKTYADNVKAVADRYTLSQLNDIAWGINPWSKISYNDQKAPSNAVKARIDVRIWGEGTVYIDNTAVSKYEPQGLSSGVTVDDADFELDTDADGIPDGWTYNAWSGTGSLSVSSSIFKTGSKSVKIISDTSSSNVGIMMDIANDYCLTSSDGFEGDKYFSYSCYVRSESTDVQFVKIAIVYYDASNNVISESVMPDNVAVVGATSTNVSVDQIDADATAYLTTGDVTYAQKVIKWLQYQLNLCKKGIIMNMSGSPLWEAVGMGRTLQIYTLVYDAIYDSGQLSAEQDAKIRYDMAWIAMQCHNTNYFNYNNMQKRITNWNTDISAGLSVFAMGFPEYSRSESLYNWAVNELKWQITNVMPDEGVWPETSRYIGGVMRSLLPMSVVMKRTHPGDTASDWFTNSVSDPDNAIKTKFKNMFYWFVKIQTPPDPVSYRVDPTTGQASIHNTVLVPGVDDAYWETVWFAPLAWAAPQFQDSDPTFASQLMWTWNRAGKPFNTELSPGNSLAAFVFVNPDIAGSAPSLTSQTTGFFEHVLRDQFNTADEYYFLFNAGQDHVHTHLDHLGFSLWAKGVPLILDAAVKDYGISRSDWYWTPKASNRIALYDSSGNLKVNGPLLSNLLPSSFSDILDYIGADTASTVRSDKDATIAARRHVYFVKSPFKAYVLWDDMRGIVSTYTSAEYWLNFFTENNIIYSGSTAFINGYNNVSLDVSILDPDITLSSSNFGISGLGGTQYEDALKTVPINTMKYMKVPTGITNQELSYLTVLYPKTTGDSALTYTNLTITAPLDTSMIKAVKVSKSTGEYFIILLNKNTSQQNVTLVHPESLQDMKSMTNYDVSSGSVTVDIGANTLMVLREKP